MRLFIHICACMYDTGVGQISFATQLIDIMMNFVDQTDMLKDVKFETLMQVRRCSYLIVTCGEFAFLLDITMCPISASWCVS